MQKAVYDNVQTWLRGLYKKPDHAYALRYDYAYKNNALQHLYLVYVPGVAGHQSSLGIGHSRSIFGNTLSLDIHDVGSNGCMFSVISHAEKAPKLKVTLGGKTIRCDITVVDYDPTVFALVPDNDIPVSIVTDSMIPEQ